VVGNWLLFPNMWVSDRSEQSVMSKNTFKDKSPNWMQISAGNDWKMHASGFTNHLCVYQCHQAICNHMSGYMEIICMHVCLDNHFPFNSFSMSFVMDICMHCQ